VEGSRRGVFKTLIPNCTSREWGKPRKYCHKTPPNSGPPKYVMEILTTQPRSSLNEKVRVKKKTVVIFFMVQVGSGSEENILLRIFAC
jgi:hypothetical protein